MVKSQRPLCIFLSAFLFLQYSHPQTASSSQASPAPLPDPHDCACDIRPFKTAQPLIASVPRRARGRLSVCSIVPENRNDPQFVVYGMKSKVNGFLRAEWKDADLFYAQLDQGKQLGPMRPGVASLRPATSVKQDESKVECGNGCAEKVDSFAVDKQLESLEVKHYECTDHKIDLAFAYEQKTPRVTLGAGKSVAFSPSLKSYAETLELPAEVVKRYEVGLEEIAPLPHWHYQHTLIAYGLGITTGAVARASGGPRWIVGATAGAALTTQVSLELLHRHRFRSFFRNALGAKPNETFTVLDNNSSKPVAISPKQDKGSQQPSGSLLIFQPGSVIITGMSINTKTEGSPSNGR